MKQYRKFLDKLAKEVNEGYELLQNNSYAVNANTHKEFLDLTKNNSHINFYNMLQLYKNAGKNVLRIISLEKELIKEPNYKIQQKLHEDTKEQTDYFLLNITGGIEQIHKFVKNQTGLTSGDSRKQIQDSLIKNPKTQTLGKLLKSCFYEDYGSDVINLFRNSLVHDNKLYQIIREKTNISNMTNFKISIIGDTGLEDKLKAPYDASLVALPLSDTEIPRNPYIYSTRMTINKIRFKDKENLQTKKAFNKEDIEATKKVESEINKVHIMYKKIEHLLETESESGTIPTLNLCDFLTNIYQTFANNSGVIVSESMQPTNSPWLTGDVKKLIQLMENIIKKRD